MNKILDLYEDRNTQEIINKLKNNFLDKAKKYYKEDQYLQIKKALEFSEIAHKEQVREASGLPYIVHPIAVAEIIIYMKLDSNSVLTALLHDTVEDTKTTFCDLENEFGNEVKILVDGVTKISKLKLKPGDNKQARNFSKLLLAMSEDIRIILIKLADRLHNMQTLSECAPDKVERVSRETLEIYAPIANKIGLNSIKNELQSISFKNLYPEIEQSLRSRLNEIEKKEDYKLSKIIKGLENIILTRFKDAKIEGRIKTPYSIWKKMENKKIPFNQLSDIIAFRIIVNSIEECYIVLGIIHTNYKFVHNGFDDYISTPKKNGYSSLHTVIIVANGQAIEIQIRTHEMNEIAINGIAAHWKYKEQEDYGTDNESFYWLRELISMLKNSESLDDFLEHSKMTIYYNQVFCFSDNGELISLPKGATVLDFAYAMNINLGNYCIGAIINDQTYPISKLLSNGDQVSILTSDEIQISENWEKYSVTGKARFQMRKLLNNKKKTQNIIKGKNLLNEVMKYNYIQYNDNIENLLLKISNKNNIDDLYFDIGIGNINAEKLIKEI